MHKISNRSAVVLALIALLCLTAPASALSQAMGSNLELGGNVNEHPDWLTPGVLAQTRTTWVRTFIPASEFISGRRSYQDDPGLEQLRAAARSGHKVILSIKWDCNPKRKPGIRIPAPGSKEEQTWFKFADNLIAATSGSVSILVVENELFIDTLPQDLVPGPDGQVPVVRFLKRLVDHIAATHPLDADGKPLPIYAGGFTRLDQEKSRQQTSLRPMLDWINNDPNIAGCDFHLHQPDVATSRDALEFMHQSVPNKPLIITEFSLVWKWSRNLADHIDASPAGAAFDKKYGLTHGATVADFFNAAHEHPVPEAEWNEFLASQPWFEPHYLDEIGPLMQENGVKVATYALTLNPLRSRVNTPPITEDTKAWFLNNLLIPGFAVANGPKLLPENDEFFDSFVRWQMKHGGA